jgi:hypothetical protein
VWLPQPCKTVTCGGQVSQLAKREGFLVTMAPMESYLDPSSSKFDRYRVTLLTRNRRPPRATRRPLA